MTSSLGDRVRSLRLPPPDSSRSSLATWLPWGLCALLAAGCGWLGYLAFVKAGVAQTVASAGDAAGSNGSRNEDQAAAPAAPVGKFALESKGYIIPAKRIMVSPKVSGMMIKLNIEEGQIVAKGEVLGVIEKVEYEKELNRALAAKEVAFHRWDEAKNGPRQQERTQVDAELEEAQRQIVQYTADLKRAEDLHTRNVITQQDYDAATARVETMQKRIKRLDAAQSMMDEGTRPERRKQAEWELKQAEAELGKAQWRLDNCEIRAPIAGTILKKNTEEGNIVNSIAFNGSYSVCDIADLADLEVDLNIQERDISKVFVGQKCEVRAEAYPSRVYQGFVSRLMPIADRAKGAIPVRVKLSVPKEEQGEFLKPDMGAVVAFLSARSAESR